MIRGSLDTREFVAFWLDANRITAVMNVNVWDVIDAVKPIIAARRPVDPAGWPIRRSLRRAVTPIRCLPGAHTRGVPGKPARHGGSGTRTPQISGCLAGSPGTGHLVNGRRPGCWGLRHWVNE
ncbi:hypothetical protein [Acidipropionibacterium acidipropionici]|uniref:hypothetical protein n=1 Tax=Acidipropionibacterium acidipropionici TaxID=1748 RepID=UPI001C2FBC42